MDGACLELIWLSYSFLQEHLTLLCCIIFQGMLPNAMCLWKWEEFMQCRVGAVLIRRWKRHKGKGLHVASVRCQGWLCGRAPPAEWLAVCSSLCSTAYGTGVTVHSVQTSSRCWVNRPSAGTGVFLQVYAQNAAGGTNT